MKLTFDTDLASLIHSPGFTSPVLSLTANRGDGEHLEVMLTRSAVPWQAPAGAELRWIIKGGTDADAFADSAPTLALADTFTYDSSRQLYTADVNYRTLNLDALFTAGVAAITCHAQFAWRASGVAKWKRSQPV
ncbi:MAG: hypothetical protein Q8M07_03160, partial [Prosthecobacter sp.]|nr:hypothetical protein [Prosthecobacter sp.]